MEKYSIEYSYTNSRFVIQNIDINKDKNTNSKYDYLIYCIKNKIQNNTYQNLSNYIKDKIGIIDFDQDKKIALIDREVPKWINAIKGDEEKSYYPAKDFYENILPNLLKGYEFIQKLAMPEASINEIVGFKNEAFKDQHVDFYISPCKLVIEIDGYHHRRKVQKDKDKKRDDYLLGHNIKTVRIKTIEIKSQNKSFDKKINAILDRFSEYDESLILYKYYYNTKKYNKEEIKYLRIDAIIRMKMTILSLLEKGIIELDDYIWRFNILTRDIHDFIGISIEDLFIDIECQTNLNDIDFKRPIVEILECKDYQFFKYNEDYINIDFSLKKRWTDENDIKNNIIFVRTDYY